MLQLFISFFSSLPAADQIEWNFPRAEANPAETQQHHRKLSRRNFVIQVKVTAILLLLLRGLGVLLLDLFLLLILLGRLFIILFLVGIFAIVHHSDQRWQSKLPCGSSTSSSRSGRRRPSWQSGSWLHQRPKHFRSRSDVDRRWSRDCYLLPIHTRPSGKDKEAYWFGAIGSIFVIDRFVFRYDRVDLLPDSQSKCHLTNCQYSGWNSTGRDPFKQIGGDEIKKQAEWDQFAGCIRAPPFGGWSKAPSSAPSLSPGSLTPQDDSRKPRGFHLTQSTASAARTCPSGFVSLKDLERNCKKRFQPVAQKSALSWRLPFQRRTISGHDAAAASLCIRRASRACSRRCVDELQISSFGTAGVVESASLSLSLGAAIWPTFGSIVTLFGPGSTETLFGFTAGFGLTSGFFGSTIGASAGLALAGLPLQAAAASEQEAFLLGQNWSMRPLKIAFRSGSPKPSFSKVSAASNWSDSEVPFTFEADGPNLGWWWTHPFSKKKGSP